MVFWKTHILDGRRCFSVSRVNQVADGGAFNIHHSASVTFLGDALIEDIDVEGSGAGMFIIDDVSRVLICIRTCV